MTPEEEEIKDKVLKCLDSLGVYITGYDSYDGEEVYCGTEYYIESYNGNVSINIGELT